MTKKFFLSLVVLLGFTISMLAQYSPHSHYGNSQRDNNSFGGFFSRDNTYYGFRIGLGFASVSSDAPALDAGHLKTGLNLGFVIGSQMVSTQPLFFETGLTYKAKGGKSSVDSKKTVSLNYFELPFVIKYKYSIDQDFAIEPLIGGYFALGVAGKIKNYANRTTNSSFNKANFSRFDGGLKLGCRLNYQIVSVGLSYDIGLANVGRDDFDDTRTGSLNLDFGVTF